MGPEIVVETKVLYSLLQQKINIISYALLLFTRVRLDPITWGVKNYERGKILTVEEIDLLDMQISPLKDEIGLYERKIKQTIRTTEDFLNEKQSFINAEEIERYISNKSSITSKIMQKMYDNLKEFSSEKSNAIFPISDQKRLRGKEKSKKSKPLSTDTDDLF